MKLQSKMCVAVLGLAVPFCLQAQQATTGIIGEKSRVSSSATVTKTGVPTQAVIGEKGKVRPAVAVIGEKGKRAQVVLPAARTGTVTPAAAAGIRSSNQNDGGGKGPPNNPSNGNLQLTGAAAGRAGMSEHKEPPKEPKDPKGPDKLSSQLLRNQALRTDPALQQADAARNMEAAQRAANAVQGQP